MNSKQRNRKYYKEPVRAKNTKIEIKNTLVEINKRLEDTEEWISELAGRQGNGKHPH